MWRRARARRRRIARRRRPTALARLRAGAAAAGNRRGARARRRASTRRSRRCRRAVADAVVKAPVGGIVTSKLLDAGEMAAPRAPIVVVTDLDHAWANVYVDEPAGAAAQDRPAGDALITDAGQRLTGTITFISPKAEFTPRNVQTAEERSKLVYRIKVTADNRDGVLKPGMPVEAELPSAGAAMTGGHARRLDGVTKRYGAVDRARRADVRRRSRRDVRADRSRRRRQDDDDPADRRAAARPTPAASRCSGRDPVARPSRHHRRGRLPVAALQPLRRPDASTRTSRSSPRSTASRASSRRAIGCST